jgi:phenylacetic acid degradation operon negative regulatory protein
MLRESNTGDPDVLLERPLSARSLIASLLLRSRPPRMRGARLVQWCGLFGVAEGTTRVALSRMVERGELRTRDGVYELAGRVQSRQGAQDWSLDPVLSRWRGHWRVAVVAPGPRDATERAALRDGMRRLRCAPLREGMWTRPDNLPRASAPAESWKIVDAQCLWWSGRPDDDPVALAAALFDSAGWADRAGRLTSRLAGVTHALAGSDDGALADGFVAGAASLAHVRADPFLPRALAADPSVGDALRRAYRTYEVAFSNALRAWFLRH